MTRRYDEYVNSKSLWLGEIPAHWRVGRLDHVASTWTSNVDKHSVEGQQPVRLCNYTDVYKNPTIVEEMDFMRATATTDQVERFRLRRGDTIITKDSETANDIGIPAYVEYEADDLICGYHLAMIRPDTDSVSPRFLYWALGAGPTLGQWAVQAAGVTRVGIRSTDLAKATLVLPPVREQAAIAEYLDQETVKIDGLVAEQEGLIEVLRERRIAVVRHGIADPTTAVNADRLSRFTRVGNGSTPRRENVAYWQGGSFPWLNSAVVNQHRVVGSDQFVTDTALAECHLPRVPAGSVLVGLTGQGRTRGMATVLDIDATISQHVAYVTPDPRKWYSEYLRWALTAAYVELRALSDENGSTKGGLTCEDLKRFRVVMPTVQEQRKIADHLAEQTEKIDVLIAEAEGIVAVAKERRSALITAAVTGQIDVRGEVA